MGAIILLRGLVLYGTAVSPRNSIHFSSYKFINLSKTNTILFILLNRFDRLREKNPEAISRVKLLEGNLLYANLGLSPEDTVLLKDVEVVFHAGGSINNVYGFCQTELPHIRALTVATDLSQHRNFSEVSLEDAEKVQGIPLALLRLPTMGPATREPMPGFVEILRGPTALMIGAGFGFGRSDLPAEIVPVDLAVNALIMSAWERGTRLVKV